MVDDAGKHGRIGTRARLAVLILVCFAGALVAVLLVLEEFQHAAWFPRADTLGSTVARVGWSACDPETARFAAASRAALAYVGIARLAWPDFSARDDAFGLHPWLRETEDWLAELAGMQAARAPHPDCRTEP